MNENEILAEEIDRYLDGSMDALQKAGFEKRLAESNELQTEVNLQRSIIKAIRREQLEKIIEKEEGKIAKKGKVRKLIIAMGSLAIAASVLGFFYVGYLNNCESLANRYYMSYAYTPVPSRGGETLPLTKSDSTFFAALHQLEFGNKSEAITQLENLNNSNPVMIAASPQAVKWYLALAYLKNAEKKKASKLLTEIANMPDNAFKTKAIQLSKEL